MALMAELMLQAFVRALAWARVAAWACRLGAGRAWCQGGLVSRRGSSLRAGFFESNGRFAVIIGPKITAEQLPISPQSRRAHRDSRLRFRGHLQFDDPCRPWASLALQPIVVLHLWPRVQGSRSRSAAYGLSHPGHIANLPGSLVSVE